MDISVAVRCRFVAVGIRFVQNDRTHRDHVTLTSDEQSEEGEAPHSASPFFNMAPVRIEAILFARSAISLAMKGSFVDMMAVTLILFLRYQQFHSFSQGARLLILFTPSQRFSSLYFPSTWC